MDFIVNTIGKIMTRLPGPGKIIFGALVADPKAFQCLVACIVAVLATALQPPVLSLYTPELQQGLRNPGSSAPLLVAAGYLLLAVLTLVGGASGDIFGRKRFLLFGLYGVLATNIAGLFTVGTPWYVWVNTFNTISSVLVIPMCVALVTIAFPLQVRPFAYGAIFAAQGISLVTSSSINGIAVAVGHQWVGFLPAIAMGIYAIRLVRRDTENSRAPSGTSRTELILNVVWASAIFTLVYGLLSLGGGVNTFNLFLVVAICIIGFVVGYRWVIRRMRGSRIRLYDVRDLSLAIFSGIMLSVGQSSFFYQIGSFFQKIQEVGPIESGLRMLPFVLAMLIATFAIVRLSMRFDARRIIAGGLVIMGVGMGALIILQQDTPYIYLLVPLLLMGFGFGIATPARTVVVLTVPPPGIVGMSAGVNSAAGQSGFALGTIISSILVTLFAGQSFVSRLRDAGAPESVVRLASNLYQNVFARVIAGNLTNVPDDLAQQVTLLFGPSFSHGLGLTYLVVGLLLVGAAVIIYFGMSKGLKGSFIDHPPGMEPPVKPDASIPAKAG